MSDHEKYEQVGRVAEEVSHLKGELNHINEKLNRAFQAYLRMTQGQMPGNWSAHDGKIIVQMTAYQSGQMAEPEWLLGFHELREVLEKRQKLTGELQSATDRLRGLAPHLL